MKKKIIALLMTVSMTVTLCACGSSAGSQTAAETSAAASEETSAAASAASEETTPAAAETSEETASASDTTDAELPTLRIALPTWVGYGPLYVAQEKGFFKENGVNVELSIVEGLAERKQALISGNLEGLATAVDVFVNLQGAGIPMKMVWLLDRSNGADGIVAKSDITSPADLKGKNVATEIGTTEHLFLLKVLEQYGLTADDITLVPMNIGDAGTAFVAGKVDAAVTYDPYLSQGIEAGGTSFTTADYDIDLMDAVGFTDDVIENEPDAVQGFTDGLAEAVAYAADNKDECIPIMAEGLKLEDKDVSDTIDKLECFSLDENLDRMGASDGEKGKLYDSVQDISDFYVNQGIMDSGIEPDSIIDPDFIRNISR